MTRPCLVRRLGIEFYSKMYLLIVYFKANLYTLHTYTKSKKSVRKNENILVALFHGNVFF